MSVTDHAAWKVKRQAPRIVLSGGKSALTTVAGRLYSLWLTAPDAGAAPTTAAAPTKATAGSLRTISGSEFENTAGVQRIVGVRGSCGSPGRLYIVDRLSHQGGLSGIVTIPQVTNFPTAALTRSTSGVGVRIGVEISSQVGTTGTTITASYMNEAGLPGQNTPTSVFGGTGFREASRMVVLPNAAGDGGAQAVAGLTLAASTGTAGAFGVTLFKPLLSLSVQDANRFDWDPLEHAGGQSPEIPNDACLQLLWMANATTTGGFELEVLLAED